MVPTEIWEGESDLVRTVNCKRNQKLVKLIHPSSLSSPFVTVSLSLSPRLFLLPPPSPTLSHQFLPVWIGFSFGFVLKLVRSVKFEGFWKAIKPLFTRNCLAASTHSGWRRACSHTGSGDGSKVSLTHSAGAFYSLSIQAKITPSRLDFSVAQWVEYKVHYLFPSVASRERQRRRGVRNEWRSRLIPPYDFTYWFVLLTFHPFLWQTRIILCF